MKKKLRYKNFKRNRIIGFKKLIKQRGCGC